MYSEWLIRGAWPQNDIDSAEFTSIGETSQSAAGKPKVLKTVAGCSIVNSVPLWTLT